MKICTYLVYSLVTGLVIMIFPYVMTLFNRFNKDRVLAWRKFFLIISVCYLPYIIILAGVNLFSDYIFIQIGIRVNIFEFLGLYRRFLNRIIL